MSRWLQLLLSPVWQTVDMIYTARGTFVRHSVMFAAVSYGSADYFNLGCVKHVDISLLQTCNISLHS
jgi:hypothetical protein